MFPTGCAMVWAERTAKTGGMSHLAVERTDIAQRYAETGVVLMRQLLTPAEVDRIRAVYTTQIETDRSLGFDDGLPADDILSRYPRIVHPHRRPDSEVGEIALELMLDERVLDVVTELIGPALAAQSMFYFKPRRPAARPCTRTTSTCRRTRRPASPPGSRSTTATPTTAGWP